MCIIYLLHFIGLPFKCFTSQNYNQIFFSQLVKHRLNRLSIKIPHQVRKLNNLFKVTPLTQLLRQVDTVIGGIPCIQKPKTSLRNSFNFFIKPLLRLFFFKQLNMRTYCFNYSFPVVKSFRCQA